jgi:hypothetical protein
MSEPVSREGEMEAQEQNKGSASRLQPIRGQKRRTKDLKPLLEAKGSGEEEGVETAVKVVEGEEDAEASRAKEQEAAAVKPADQLKALPQAPTAPPKTPDQLMQLPPEQEASPEAAAEEAKRKQELAAAEEKKKLEEAAVVAAAEEDDDEKQPASQPHISEDLSIKIQNNRKESKNIDFSYTRRTKNIIGFHSDYSTSYNNVLEDTDNLGTTTSFYKIFYSEGNENPNNITNILKNISEKNLNIDIEDMLLTKIEEEKKEDDITHLFSIQLKPNNNKSKKIIFKYPNESLDVDIYILVMNDNKIDFNNMYKNPNNIPDLPYENLKYILFLGKFDILKIWSKRSMNNPTDNLTMESLICKKVLFIYSKHPTIPGRLLPFTNNKINLKQPINIVDYNTEFSKEVLFSLYNIDFITFTEEHFDKMIENKQHGGCCGVNNEIDDVVDSIEDVKDVKEDVKIGGDKVVKKKVKNKLPKKGKKSTKIADIES